MQGKDVSDQFPAARAQAQRVALATADFFDAFVDLSQRLKVRAVAAFARALDWLVCHAAPRSPSGRINDVLNDHGSLSPQ